MAKRNLLTDMNYHIRKWETMKGTAVSLQPSVVALKDAIKQKLKELSPTAFKYRQVASLGFNVACNDPANDEYFRFSNNDVVDMEKKCAELMSAIQHAQNMVAGSPADNDKTLKIFMAPEFYFRGVNGAYSFDVASRIIPKMGDLGTNKSTYQHWLFVFGTAVAASEEEVTYCPTCKFSPNGVTFNLDSTTGRTQAVCATNPAHKLVTGTFGAEVHNVALIKKGADSHIVAKEYVSHIDYENNKVTVVQDTSSKRTMRTLDVVAPQGSVESRIASKFRDERMGGGVFTIDGITFGMEICLDHARPTATGGRMVEYANSIQILLIPSFGMEILFHSCTVGGIIFNVDGHRQESKAVIKGAAGDPASTLATAPSTRGEIEVFGPFPIPRRA